MDPVDPQTPQANPAYEPPEEYNPQHKTHVAPARSFSSDLANAIREKGGSVVRIAIAEEEKRRREKEESSAGSQKNLIFIIATMLIVIGALGAIVWVYMYKTATPATPVVSTPTLPSSIVSADDAQVIDITGMKVADILASVNAIVTNPNLQSGEIKNIVVTQGSGAAAVRIPANQFINALGMHAPSDFLRSLSNEYMLGVYSYNGKDNLFIIVKGSAHDFLLAGMLGWEQKMFNDMVPLFNIDTTGLTTAQLQSMPFNDLVIENRDTRAVLDANKKPLFFYSFLDQDTIIMATDPKTLSEVVRRF